MPQALITRVIEVSEPSCNLLMSKEAMVAKVNWMVPSKAEAEPLCFDWRDKARAVAVGEIAPMLDRKIKIIKVKGQKVGSLRPIRIRAIPANAGTNRTFPKSFSMEIFFKSWALIWETATKPTELIAKSRLYLLADNPKKSR